MVTIEVARAADLRAILDLLATRGLPQDGLADHLDATLVARDGDRVLGCAALEQYGSAALLRSVAVAADQQGGGLGQRLTRAALDLGRERGIDRVYLLTETAADFFPRFGFRPCTRDAVPGPVKQSVEFVSACPASALVLAADL